jgi:SAM-dependent methyltransferase
MSDNSNDLYSNRLVQHWDGLQGDIHYSPAAKFIYKELNNRNLPKSVFEIGCGTGRLIPFLFEAGIEQISTWDRSPSMREEASKVFSKYNDKVSWLDPTEEDTRDSAKSSFGAFIGQRLSPTQNEFMEILLSAKSLLVPGGIAMIGYWTGAKINNSSEKYWNPIDIDFNSNRICVRLNDWDFKEESDIDYWRSACIYYESGKFDMEANAFPLPKLSQQFVLNITTKYGFSVVSMEPSKLRQMGVRILLEFEG